MNRFNHKESNVFKACGISKESLGESIDVSNYNKTSEIVEAIYDIAKKDDKILTEIILSSVLLREDTGQMPTPGCTCPVCLRKKAVAYAIVEADKNITKTRCKS